MDGSLPPPRHAPPHIRLNSGSAGDILEMQPTGDSEQYSRRLSRPTSTRSLIPQARSVTAPNPNLRGPGHGIYQNQAPAESAELLLPPRKSKTRRYRDDDSPMPSGDNSRRTSWSSGSERSRDSNLEGPFASPFSDSRAPSRAGSDDDNVNTQTVSEKYNILPSAGLLLFPEDVEKDDWLHTPDPNDNNRITCSDLFSKRGMANVGGLAFIILGILTLFIVFPILTFARQLLDPGGGQESCSQNPDCISSTVPLLQNVRSGLIDPDTPSSAHSITGTEGQTLSLKFSDEFNDDDRTFYAGDDPFYQAVDIWYGVTQDLEWYDPDAITTSGGTLNIRFDAFQNHDLSYRSGMLQSWNMLCFKGGYVEASISLPGAGDVVGFWPGWWTMGNLGRPGYAATTEGMWPFSYHDDCDAGITPNQSMTDGTSWLPGMKIPACACDGEDTPSPGTARSAPEIDAIEASNYYLNGDTSEIVGAASQSFQVAPFDIWYRPDPEFQEIYDYALTQANSYQGGPYQQAVSALTTLSNDWYNGNAYQTYGYEYEPGSDGYITWVIGGQPTWKTTGTSMRPNGNVGQRVMPEEPMALIMNFGMADSFSAINLPGIFRTLPATMRVDYIRIYQDDDGEMGCDPEGYPTTDYIAAHPEPYNNPNITSWSQTQYSWPQNSYMDGCSSSSSKRMLKRSEKRALRRKQAKEKLQKRSWWSPWG